MLYPNESSIISTYVPEILQKLLDEREQYIIALLRWYKSDEKFAAGGSIEVFLRGKQIVSIDELRPKRKWQKEDEK